jgi:hypothetical protein
VRDGKAGRDTSLARNDKKHSGFGLCRHLNRKRSKNRPGREKQIGASQRRRGMGGQIFH